MNAGKASSKIALCGILTALSVAVKPIARGCTGSVGVKERGERAKVISAYLGGLTDS